MAEGSSHGSRGESEEIATSTLAEIYAQQGLLGRALAIYRRMQARSPEDTVIADRIERLERRIVEAGVEETDAAARPPAAEAAPLPLERERLPWDPPPPEREPEPEPELTPDPAPAERVGRMDAGAFAAWLEGR